MVIPSGPESSSPPALPNGYTHALAIDEADHELDMTAKGEYSPSGLHDVSESSSEADVADESYDAGSPASDGEDEDAVMGNSEDESDHYGENSSSSHRSLKRKSTPPDETEYMRQNPDLYGLRRSGRAHLLLNVADSSESDSDVGPRKRRRKEPSQRPQKTSRSTTVTSATESDSDEYGPKKANKASRRRRLKEASMGPSLTEVRFSTRKAARTNYNEDEDDDIFEDDQDQLQPNYWATDFVEDTRPAVDVVLNHRLKEGVDPKSTAVDRQDFEFYIKWQDKAHIHATWEANESLVNYRSPRRVDNYVRKVLNEDLRLQHDPYAAPEDREKWNLDRERDIDAIEDYKKVERVIGVREGEDGTEYYVKWKRLFYDSCTWEAEDLVSEIAQREIDRFIDRSARLPVSDPKESNPATRKPFDFMRESPYFLENGKLKDFQIEGLNFLAFKWVKNHNVVLADEMGLGKTVQTVSFINWLRHNRRQQGPFIVIVPLSTMPAWAETFDNWTPDLNYVVYNGSEKSRDVLRDYELMVDGNPKRPKFHVLLTTYEYAMNDSAFLGQFKWQFMAVDEAHRLKNRDSQLYVKLLEWKCQARLLITGTPVQNNLAELASLMDFLNPGIIHVDEDMDFKDPEASSKKLAELVGAIQPFMLRRTKSQVESDLPPKTEKIIRVELSDIQLEYYKNILTKNYAALNSGGGGAKQSLLNIMMELKKASNHPFMFPNAEARILNNSTRREDILRAMITSSGKMMLLDQLLRKLKADNHRVLIFCQMVGMLNILSEYMEYRGYSYQRLDGTIPSAARRLAIDHYNAAGSTDFAFLLSTRAGGLGINLMTADTVVLFDSDWNPQADLQAMARAHRIGQTRPVSVYRLVSKDTVEEEVLERARNKLLLEFITIQNGVTDQEATDIHNKMKTRPPGEPTSSQDISRILKRRGQKMFEQTDNQKKLEQLDIDSVLANAELHQTAEEGIQADGGEDFQKIINVKLQEYQNWQAEDNALDNKDLKDFMSKDMVEKIEAEQSLKESERLAETLQPSQPRKRQAPNYMTDSREERKAKRQARAQVAIDDGDDESSSLDPKRPLGEKEYRALSRAFLRYGDMDDCEKLILEDSRLQTRDRETVRAALREITDKAAALVQENVAQVEALKQSGKNLTKKEQKAVLFDHHGVKRLNAFTIVDRPTDMRLVRGLTSSLSDFKTFRLPEATKLADYSCSWGAREDGMLLIGIARHGFGAWTQIRDDVDLGLTDKFFLEEHRVERKTQRAQGEEKATKSPGAVHLVRRAEYLLSVLRNKHSRSSNTTAKRAVENHHRNNKRNSRVGSGSVSASPAPSARKGQREADRPRQRSHTHGSREGSGRHSTPNNDRSKSGYDGDRPRHRLSDTTHDDHRRRGHEHGSSSREDMAFMFFKPIVPNLKQVSMITAKNYPEKADRARKLRNTIVKIGEFIDSTLEGQQSMPSLERRLWDYVSVNYWPNKEASGAKLQQMFMKVQEASKASKVAATST